MLARLWWKEARLFWPIWVFLAATAVAVQWLALRYMGPDARTGVLGAFATGWAVLYGFAVTAAAFAGERENRTLAFLDTLPVGRGLLWSGKASFAMVSTLALAAALFGLASSATRVWNTGPVSGWAMAFAALALLLEVLGWGLFWSAVSGRALTAAVLAVGSAGLVLPLTLSWLDVKGAEVGFVASAPYRLGAAVLLSFGSALVVTRPRTRPADPYRLAGSDGPPRRRDRPRAAWPSAARALGWASAREVASVWWAFAAVGLVVPLLAYPWGGGAVASVALILIPLTTVAAGVSLFGGEARQRTNRFLAHHGVRPGLAWGVKTAAWGAALVSLWVPLTVLGWAAGQFSVAPASPDWRVYSVYAGALAVSAAVGQLTGMVVRRGITGVVLGAVVVFAVVVPMAALCGVGMLTPWGMAVSAAVLLGVGWGWSGDWLVERPGARRWVRLAGLLILATAGLFGGYVTARVVDMPTLPPHLERQILRENALGPQGFTPAEPGAAGNAAALYAEADRLLPTQGDPDDLSDADREAALTLVRRGSALPECRFARLSERRLYRLPPDPSLDRVFELLADSVRRRQERGDLAGAWDDLLVTFRVARHQADGVPLTPWLRGLIHERTALGQAMRWAADARQTPERLRAALTSYRELRPMPTAADAIRAEAFVTDRTLGGDLDELRAWLASDSPGRGPRDTLRYLAAETITTPWELARARRALRLLFASWVVSAESEPGRRMTPGPDGAAWTAYIPTAPGSLPVPDPRVWRSDVLRDTPLAERLAPSLTYSLDLGDFNEVVRRALVQILALRDWQARHGGKLPESLGALIPSELDRLPDDPYACRPFGYVISGGQLLYPLGVFGEVPGPVPPPQAVAAGDARLLYSVGRDRHDTQATQVQGYERSPQGDIIFPLVGDPRNAPEAPPAEPAPGVK